jgi:hypothetical protein
MGGKKPQPSRPQVFNSHGSIRHAYPCGEGERRACLEKKFLHDIGDEQNLKESVSTFLPTLSSLTKFYRVRMRILLFYWMKSVRIRP